MNIEDLPDDSDTSDEDYEPVEKQEDLPSEIDSDGEPEDVEFPSDSENHRNRGQKRLKKASKLKKKVKKTSQRAGSSNGREVEDEPEKKQDNNDTNVDDIWADFIKDTGFTSKSSKSDTNNSKSQASKNKPSDKVTEPTEKQPSQRVKITQVFEFAGEEVKVEKEVAANSAEARLLSNASDDTAKPSSGRKSGGLSGISGVLSQLGKKQKISTLEKSKLDWDKFKKEENIEEELQTYNKGKDGFLERQDFLQRADLRRFEIEKDIRTVERNKRFNSTL